MRPIKHYFIFFKLLFRTVCPDLFNVLLKSFVLVLLLILLSEPLVLIFFNLLY